MQAGPVRRGAILCALCLVMTGAGASGARLRTSSSSVGTPATAKRVHGAQLILLGQPAIEPKVDHNFVGTVEAFAFRARHSGTAASISVYLDARDRAQTLFAGLYSSRHGRPRTLLTSGLRRSPRAGAWNPVAVRSARVRSGRTYWLVVLGKGGAVYFRDRRSCSGDRSSKRSAGSLPRTWPHGRNSRVCLISAYVKGAKGSSGRKVFGPHAPSGTSGTGTGGGASPVNSVGPYFTASTGDDLVLFEWLRGGWSDARGEPRDLVERSDELWLSVGAVHDDERAAADDRVLLGDRRGDQLDLYRAVRRCGSCAGADRDRFQRVRRVKPDGAVRDLHTGEMLGVGRELLHRECRRPPARRLLADQRGRGHARRPARRTAPTPSRPAGTATR